MKARAVRPHLPDEILRDVGVKDAWDCLKTLVAAENRALDQWAYFGGSRGFDDWHPIREWNKAASHRRKLKKAAVSFETAVLDAMVRHHDQPDYTRYYTESWMSKLEERGDVTTGRDERNMPVWIWVTK